MNIQKHIGNIDKKLDEDFKQNYNLNKNISVKSICLYLDIFINQDYYKFYPQLWIKFLILKE